MTNVNDIQVGDRVRLTHMSGDVAEFTVKTVKGDYATSKSTGYFLDKWGTVEVIEKAFKPVPGLYSNTHTGEHVAITKDETAYYTCRDGVWIDITWEVSQAYDAARELVGWERRFAF